MDMADEMIDRVLEDERSGASVEVPGAPWEQLLTWGIDPWTLQEVRDQFQDLSG